MLYIIIVVINLALGLTIGSNRLLGFLSLLGLGWLIASDYVETNGDYSNYLIAYNNVSSGVTPFERGYTQLEMLAYNQGLTYAEFRLWFSLVTVIILYIAIVRFTNNVALFVALFATTTFFTDGTQIRNLMMIAIVILATSFLKKLSVINIIIFVVFIYLATQLHSSGYSFFIILLFRVLPYDKLKNVALIFFSFIMLVSLSLKLFGFGMLYNLLVKIFGTLVQRVNFLTKLQSYTNGTNISTILLLWLTILFSISISFLIYSMLKKFEIEQITVKSKLLFSGMTVSIIAMPLVVMAPDYSRIARNATLFLFILIAYYYELARNNKKIAKQLSNYRKKFIVSLLIMLIPFVYVHNTIWGPTFLNSIPYTIKLKSPYIYNQ